MNKKTISAVIIVILLAVAIYQGFLKKEEPAFTLAEVIRGELSQEISETGQVQKGEALNLSFKNGGRIEKIYVKVGEEVTAGKILAKLNTVSLAIQLQEAKAALAITQAKLDKLLAGASQEEIQVAETKVANEATDLAEAEQDLADVYEDALNILDDAYLKAYNAQNTADSIQRSYFINNDQAGIDVRENKGEIESAVSQIKSDLDAAKTNPSHQNINSALSQTKEKLSDTADALKIIRETCEKPNYRNDISSTDKTSLDTQRTNINTALTNVTNAQQSISSAQFSVDSAEGDLQAAQDDLALTKAPARPEDIDLYQAQVDQAQAQVQILENQIDEAYLSTPLAGQITKIAKRIGEVVQSGDSLITLLPAIPFEIEVDIYEEDVVKIKVGNPVEISLVALPEKKFQGQVVVIEPAEKLIEGVVYYEVTIAFEEMPEVIKSGMTADLVIKTVSKENVLIIPEEALIKKNGRTIVKVLRNGVIEEQEIEIGLQGSNDLVEVIFGLAEGEEVILSR